MKKKEEETNNKNNNNCGGMEQGIFVFSFVFLLPNILNFQIYFINITMSFRSYMHI